MDNSIYANARAISLQNFLLGADRLGRMAECGSKTEALKILAEVNFGEGAAGDGYEAIIAAEENKFFDFVREVSPSENFKKYLLIGNDYHNAEVFSRCKYLKIQPEKMLVGGGLYKTEQLKDWIFADDYKNLGKILADTLLEADNIFVLGKADGKTISGLFRRAYYKELEKIAAKEKLLKRVYSAKADSVNISLALRTRDFQEAQSLFVGGGTLTSAELKTLSEEPAESLKERFKYSPLKEIIESAVESFSKGKPLTEFEKITDGFTLKLLKENKYDVESYRPFMLYCYYKLAEIDNVRIILSCLDNGIDKGEIKDRVRETYEG